MSKASEVLFAPLFKDNPIATSSRNMFCLSSYEQALSHFNYVRGPDGYNYFV